MPPKPIQRTDKSNFSRRRWIVFSAGIYDHHIAMQHLTKAMGLKKTGLYQRVPSKQLRTERVRMIALLGCLFYGFTPAVYSQQRYMYEHPQMGTVFRLVFYTDKDSTAARTVAQSVFAYVDSLNQLCSDYIPDSELSLLSDRAGKPGKVTISKELYEILALSKDYSKASGGAFDVTVGAVTRLWRRARHLKEVPDSARVRAAVATVDYRSIQLYRKHRAKLLIAGTRLDLGGIAQGYAADKCLNLLLKAGISQALVDAGGDIALGNAPPGSAGWVIARPRLQTDGTQGSEELWLSNCGVTTSGATYRFLEANGVRYSHIVDPRTGWGLTHRNLVTVQAPNAVTADAWATAISVLNLQEWRQIRAKHPELTVWTSIF